MTCTTDHRSDFGPSFFRDRFSSGTGCGRPSSADLPKSGPVPKPVSNVWFASHPLPVGAAVSGSTESTVSLIHRSFRYARPFARTALRYMTHILKPSALALALLSPAGHADELRVAAWNLEHLKNSDLEGCVARREADYAAIAHQVEAFGVDVVAFQEVENEAAARRVFPLSEWNVEVSTRPIADSERTCWERPEALLGRLATGFAVRRGIAYRRNRDLSALAGGDPSLRWGSDITVTRDARELRLLSVHLKSGCWGMEQDEDERPRRNLRGAPRPIGRAEGLGRCTPRGGGGLHHPG